MSKELEESETPGAVQDLPTDDNEEDDPRAAFSGLPADRILQLTEPSQGSSLIASGSTLPSIDDDEKAKAGVSKMDGSINVRKLEPPLRPSVNNQASGQEPLSGARGVSLSADQILALSENPRASRKAKQKRQAAAANIGDAKLVPPTAPSRGPVSSNDPRPNDNDSHDIDDPESSNFMTAPGAYQVEGLESTASRNNAPPSPTSPLQEKEQSLVMASAIDREALKEELRQELLAEQAATAQVAMAVPTGTDHDDNTRDSVNTATSSRRSGRMSFLNNRKWWKLLALVALLVVGAVAVALIADSGGGDGGKKKKDDGGGSPPPPPPSPPPPPPQDGGGGGGSGSGS